MLYGGDAMTGVINVILKNGESLKGGEMGRFLDIFDMSTSTNESMMKF